MTYIIIGNIIALFTSILMVYAGYVKTKKQLLFYQTLEDGLAVVSYLFLGGISGAIICLVGVLRSILCYKDRLNILWKIIITIVTSVLVIYFMNNNLIELLPLICLITYLWIITIKNLVKLKYLIIIIMILWIIYDFIVHNYVAVIFDILTILTNISSIATIKKMKNIKE